MHAVPNQVPIALLAGKGDLPATLLQVFEKQQRPFVVLAFSGQTEEKLVHNLPHIWINFGEVGKAIAYLKENQIKEVVMAGNMSRPAMNEIRGQECYGMEPARTSAALPKRSRVGYG